MLFYSLPDEPIATLRRLVRLLRRARTELGACKARFRNTLLPALGPAGEPLPAAVVVALPAPLQVLLPPAQRRALPEVGADLPPALAFELTDLAARLVSVRTRSAQIEAELVHVATPLPAYRLLLSLPGVGSTLAAILLAEIGDIAWYTKFSQLRKLAGLDILRVESGQWAGTARISRGGRALLRWALYQAALGAARTPVWRARREAMLAKRHGDRFAFFKANIELAATLLRLAWGVWRSGRPYDPNHWSGGPAARPATAPRRARGGRRGAPAEPGRAEMAQSRQDGTGRMAVRGGVDRQERPSLRRRRSA